jgi:hypothetical protein
MLLAPVGLNYIGYALYGHLMDYSAFMGILFFGVLFSIFALAFPEF